MTRQERPGWDGRWAGLEQPGAEHRAAVVTLDATAVGPAQRGLGRFQEQLAERLLARDDVVGTTLVSGPTPAGTTWRTRRVPGRWDLARVAALPLLVRPRRAGVLVTATDRLVAPRRLPVVVYVFEHPRYRTELRTLLGGVSGKERLSSSLTRWWFRRTLARADHLVCASTATARDLVFLEGVEPWKIAVAPPGPLQATSACRGGERERIVLTFVDQDPRDNGTTALDAAGALPSPWVMHVVGDPPPDVRARAERSGGRVILRGRLATDDLLELYRRSAVYLDVSLYEGFGSQAAEAVTAGLACVVSNVTSLPEVVEGRALLVDPHDPEGVTAALRRVVDDPELRGSLAADAASSDLDRRWDVLVDHLVAVVGRLSSGG